MPNLPHPRHSNITIPPLSSLNHEHLSVVLARSYISHHDLANDITPPPPPYPLTSLQPPSCTYPDIITCTNCDTDDCHLTHDAVSAPTSQNAEGNDENQDVREKAVQLYPRKDGQFRQAAITAAVGAVVEWAFGSLVDLAVGMFDKKKKEGSKDGDDNGDNGDGEAKEEMVGDARTDGRGHLRHN